MPKSLYRITPPISVPTQTLPSRSSISDHTLLELIPSLSVNVSIVSFDNRLSPSCVPNHNRPCRSSMMCQTVLLASPFLVVRVSTDPSVFSLIAPAWEVPIQRSPFLTKRREYMIFLGSRAGKATLVKAESSNVKRPAPSVPIQSLPWGPCAIAETEKYSMTLLNLVKRDPSYMTKA